MTAGVRPYTERSSGPGRMIAVTPIHRVMAWRTILMSALRTAHRAAVEGGENLDQDKPAHGGVQVQVQVEVEVPALTCRSADEAGVAHSADGDPRRCRDGRRVASSGAAG